MCYSRALHVLRAVALYLHLPVSQLLLEVEDNCPKNKLISNNHNRAIVYITLLNNLFIIVQWRCVLLSAWT